jgi:2,4-dienoyl-CoA reductase (NADPH2)
MEALFKPIDVGNLKLKNRIVMPAMHLNYTPDGEVTDRLIAFYEERAKGGAALIIVGGCPVDEYSGYLNMIDISDDRFIPGLKKLTDAVHRHGTLIASQLFHGGRYVHSAFIGRKAIAPSPIASKLTREEPREMTIEDIKYAINSFARAADRAKKAGFDAVEILSSAGYLITQFLSPVTNKRTDEYGGSFENRMRFGLEVTDAVRDAVGKDFTGLIRLGGNDFMPGGNTNREIRLFAAELGKHGIDAFDITGGWHESRVPQITMGVPRGGYTYLAREIKKVVSKPVISCNRINDPTLANKIIEEGSTDMVGFARGLMADPEMPNKARNGRLNEFTPCIGCNQGCLDNVFVMKPIECMVNPRAGRELDVPPVSKTETAKRVMVIGGGPGGLSAARTAAEAGHAVTLYERSEDLGGQLNLAGTLEEKREFRTLADALSKQLTPAGVDIHTNIVVDDDLVKAENPDVVIIATGGEPIKPGIPGVDGKTVVQAWDVLSEKVDIGNKVVVVGGGAVGIEVATYIAKIGTINADTLQFLFLNKAEDVETLRELSTKGIKKVTLIEMLGKLGADIGMTTRWVDLQMLSRYGVKAKTRTKVIEITQEGVVVEREGESELINCDTVVLAVGTNSVNSLEEKLKEVVEKVIVIGDAKAPRKALEAIKEGFFAAGEI